MNKKAITPLITTVLLVLISLVLASIIFLWANKFGGEQIDKFGEAIENACGDVSIEAAVTGDNSVSIINKGDISLHQVTLIIGGNTGTSEKETPVVDIVGGSSKVVTTTASLNGNQVELIPMLLGSVKDKPDQKEVYACTSAKIIISQ